MILKEKHKSKKTQEKSNKKNKKNKEYVAKRKARIANKRKRTKEHDA